MPGGVWASQAAQPERFPSGLVQPVATDWTWQGIDRVPRPDQVRCIGLTARQDRDEALSAAVAYRLIGNHNDGLWHIGWLVHEFRAGVSAAQQQEAIAALGCTHWDRVDPGRMLEASRSRRTGVSGSTPQGLTAQPVSGSAGRNAAPEEQGGQSQDKH